ncbi:hypothetical protein KP509_20G077800 [Ceratopteris richardii]|uniref:SBP-type domain-containing protein n=1 Tax=Ceratopteris richardii TaxID=49495 RepID=A0A8T2SGG0_CERRI|nr:hypothetical protein KP509_20G077800 [Ceratopteris richardii]
MQQRTLEPVVTQKEIFSTWSVRDNHKDSDRIAIAKPRVSRGTIAPIVGSFKGGKIDYVSSNVENGATVKTVQDEGVTMPTFEDGNIGLRLGKRIYYGDAGVGEEISRQANAGTDCSQNEENGNSKNSSSGSCITTVMTITSNSSSSTSSSNSNNTTVVSASPSTTPLSTCAAGTNSPATVAKGSNGIAKNKSSNNTNYNGNDTARNINGVANAMKKQKGSTSAVVPACQAEGCTADLSEAKDYHRRHKVCEWHSKASRAKVNNMEQRFCQQCSRFAFVCFLL